jgi:hypothetical protein
MVVEVMPRSPVFHPIRFIRWSRDAGLRDSWTVVAYPFKTWRCRLFGHDWGPEDREYEPNTGHLMQCWHECQRPRCEGYQETYHYLGANGKVYG